MKIYLFWVFCMSVVAFVLYGIDKRRAVRKKWRISEITLLMVSFMGGCFGAFLGMKVFHHKTKHAKFTILVPISIFVWIMIAFTIMKHVQ